MASLFFGFLREMSIDVYSRFYIFVTKSFFYLIMLAITEEKLILEDKWSMVCFARTFYTILQRKSTHLCA